MAMQITAKDKFNALANAKHIFAYKEEKIKFKLVDIIEGEESIKAVVELEDGQLDGLFTDSQSAKDSLKEVKAVFGADQPFIQINMRKTRSGASVYFAEVV
jgi:arginine/lysine/ornithine decarboxylase